MLTRHFNSGVSVFYKLGGTLRDYISIWRNAPTGSDLKSDLLDIVIALSERAPWLVAKRLLDRHGVPTGHGWENTLADIRLHDDLRKVDVDGLYWSFVQYASVGEKSVRYFDLSESQLATLDLALKAHSSLHRVPRPRSKSSLRKSSAQGPEIAAVIKEDEDTVAVFRSIVRREERVEMDTDTLPAQVQGVFTEYDQLIAIKAVMRESFSTIRLDPHSRRVEVRVDDLFGDSQKLVGSQHQAIYSHLHTLAGSSSVIAPVELFSAIGELYNAPDEGSVTALSFATTTGSLKSERMRSSECLRKERYHVGGKIALKTEIEPYKIAVKWKRKFDHSLEIGAPELHLDGNIQMLASSGGLYSASVMSAVDVREYRWIREKLLEYI
jgi:hypothetical protein